MRVAGIGCRGGASGVEVLAAIRAANGAANGAGRLDALATIPAKAGEPGVAAAARALALPLVIAATGADDRRFFDVVAGVAGGVRVAFGGRGGGTGGGRARSAAARSARGRRAGDLRHRRIGRRRMTVHFIGAGPGAADLITLRGRDLLAACPVCLYAGSIVPAEMLRHCPGGARLVDTAPLSLDEIEAEYVAADAAGQDVARLQSGDLSIWSATAEQIRRLERRGIAYTLTPGVPAFAAAAAALGRELTIPEVAQSLVLTRVSGRASAMPAGETLAGFGATGATLAIHLAIHAVDRIVAELTPLYGPDCPVAIVARASWPEERVVRGTLATIAAALAADPIDRTAIVFVGPGLDATGFRESALYDAGYQRRFRGRDEA